MSYPLLLFMVILGHFGEWFCFGTKWLVCLVHDHKKANQLCAGVSWTWMSHGSYHQRNDLCGAQPVSKPCPTTCHWLQCFFPWRVFAPYLKVAWKWWGFQVGLTIQSHTSRLKTRWWPYFFSNSVFLLGFWRVSRLTKKVASRPSDPRCNQGRWSGSRRLKSRALTRGTVHWSGQRNSKSPCCGGLLRARSVERRFQSPLYGSAILLLPDFAMLGI